MKIVDYLIIVSTWLLSSYTFGPAEVEFKMQNEFNGVYTVQFGVLVDTDTKVGEVEAIMATLPYHSIQQVTKTEKGIVVKLTTTEIPDVYYYSDLIKPFGFELDVNYLDM